MNQNTQSNRDEVTQRSKAGISSTTQAATEQAAARAPGSSGNVSPASHRDFDEADLRKPSPTTGRFEDIPDNQEGLGP